MYKRARISRQKPCCQWIGAAYRIIHQSLPEARFPSCWTRYGAGSAGLATPGEPICPAVLGVVGGKDTCLFTANGTRARWQGGGGGVPDRPGGVTRRVGGHAAFGAVGNSVSVSGVSRRSAAVAGRRGAGKTARLLAHGADTGRGAIDVGAHRWHRGHDAALALWNRDAAQGVCAAEGEGCRLRCIRSPCAAARAARIG